MRKRLLVAATAATIGVAGLSTGAAFAVTDSDSSTNDPMSGLVSAIATKFNLKTSDVQAVFDEQRSAMKAKHEQEIKDKVSSLVTDGKLTQAQADAINAKRAELEKTREANRDSMKDKTDEKRKTAMEAEKTALNTWLKENNIDSSYAYLLMGGRGHGPGGPGMGGPRSDADSTTDS